MKIIEVKVQARVHPFERVKAVMPVCDCGSDTFKVFVIEGGHLHLQCSACRETSCDGSCAKEKLNSEDVLRHDGETSYRGVSDP